MDKWDSELPYTLFQIMERDNVIVAYKGEITSDILGAVFPLIEIKMNQMEEALKIRKRVFNILVEILQNLYHHATKIDFKSPKEKTVIFFVGKKKDMYYVVTGNYIEKWQENNLKERLDKINSLTQEEIKELYRKTLLEGEISEKGGAGLGFIEIARKSGSKIDYAIYPVNDNYSFILLRVLIKPNP